MYADKDGNFKSSFYTVEEPWLHLLNLLVSTLKVNNYFLYSLDQQERQKPAETALVKLQRPRSIIAYPKQNGKGHVHNGVPTYCYLEKKNKIKLLIWADNHKEDNDLEPECGDVHHLGHVGQRLHGRERSLSPTFNVLSRYIWKF
jgi:hypothetical protein